MSVAADREALPAKIRAGLQQAIVGDGTAVLAPAALVAGAHLIMLADATGDLEAVHAVAWLHWARAHLVAEPLRESELAASAALFLLLLPVAPQEVPAELRELLAVYLHDGPLTVLDIASLRLARAELAFLSACQTAIGGVTLPDESIHLAAALQLAGYRHVIGTLWTIADQLAPRLAEDVYTALGANGGLDLTQAAYALHHAVRRLRAAHHNPMSWAHYVHIGP
jgi:CHAT domain